jgi:deoxyribose-phosphate aldolase
MMTSCTSWEGGIAKRAGETLERLRVNPVRPVLPQLTAAQLAAMIDHTLLKAEATPRMIDKLCAEAREYRFASVCVNPCNVARSARALAGTGVLVCSVVGFPLGASSSRVKAFEAERAIEDGAHEIDMVINVGALKGGDYALAKQDIASVAEVCHANGAHCKVIIETALLSDEEKVAACLLIVEAGADFCKTSTGFGPGGATVQDVALMRGVVGPHFGVKAAGGIRTYADAQAMIGAGASRIGASASTQIIQGVPESSCQ